MAKVVTPPKGQARKPPPPVRVTKPKPRKPPPIEHPLHNVPVASVTKAPVVAPAPVHSPMATAAFVPTGPPPPHGKQGKPSPFGVFEPIVDLVDPSPFIRLPWTYVGEQTGHMLADFQAAHRRVIATRSIRVG